MNYMMLIAVLVYLVSAYQIPRYNYNPNDWLPQHSNAAGFGVQTQSASTDFKPKVRVDAETDSLLNKLLTITTRIILIIFLPSS